MKKFQTVDAETLRRLLASDAERPVLVNALAREAFDEERIPGSISIPVADALRVAPAIMALDQPIVVYCASQSCTASPTLAQKLVDLGFTEVADFAGGIAEWQAAGLPLERTRELAAV
jgi:rhodanese-related sulfurtransferase